MDQSIFEKMAARWPSSVVARGQIHGFTGGAITARYMANIDCKGLGPARYRIGKKVVYPIADLVKWFSERTQPIQSRK
jgi:hypothetical protein